MTYSFDASIFISMKRNYPRDLHTKLWNIIEEKMREGIILISEEVVIELKNGNDELTTWIDDYSNCIIKTDEKIQNILTFLINKYSGWIDPNLTQDRADPFVIALAKNLGSTVVTGEIRNIFLEKKPEQWINQPHALKIGNVCDMEKIRCIDLLTFVVEIGTFE